MKTHCKERPHKCNQCNFASKREDRLRKHLKIHNGEEPIKCGQCDYKSFDSSNMKKHVKRHGGELWWKQFEEALEAKTSTNIMITNTDNLGCQPKELQNNVKPDQ